MPENKECSSASSCSKESCEGCSGSQQESFAADMPKQPENLSLGNLDDFEEIVSDGEVPF